MPFRSALPARRVPSLPGRVVLFGILLGVLLLGLDGWRSWHARSVEIAEDKIGTANLTRALAERLHDLVRAADALLIGTRQRIETDVVSPAVLEQPDWLAKTRFADLPALSGLFLTDTAGNWQTTPLADGQLDLDAADRAFFRFHRDNPSRDLLVSDPVQNRTDGRWLLVLSRRVDGLAGSFAGVILVTISIADIQGFLDTLEVGPHGTVTLALTDGAVVLRRPVNMPARGVSIADSDIFLNKLPFAAVGSSEYRAKLDGVRRIASYRKLDDYPFVVVVAHGLDDVLEVWWVDARFHLVISAAAAVLIGFLATRVARQIASRQVAEARYRLLAEHSSDVILCNGLDGERLYVSPSITAMTGWSPAESIASPESRFVHEADRAARDEVLQLLLDGGERATAIFRYIRRDGSHVWVEARYQRVAADGGRPGRIIGNLRDISARKAVEEQLAAANRELSEQASTDGLTGLANRRRLDEALRVAWGHAMREQQSLSVLMIDVDRFKAFNDRYGHPTGDRCLAAVAGAVAGLARRPGDVAARYGGEEIALLLPGTDLAGAVTLAELMRAAIEALGIPHSGNQPAGVVTVSVGCAALTHGGGATSIEALIARADSALYEAKRSGRNRVASGSDLPVAAVPPTAAEEEQRLAVVDRYVTAGFSDADVCLDRVARLTASLFDMPIAMVSLVGRDEQVFVGRSGLDVHSTSRDVAFCAHTILDDDIFTVADAQADPRFAHNPLVEGDPNIRFYAGAPLISPIGAQRVGALCMIDRKARPPLDSAQRALLTDLAALVVSHLERGGALQAMPALP